MLDAGGQYCHLIARKVRELGVFAEVQPSDTPASRLAGRKAVIISGGPSSVYEPGSPTVDPEVFRSGAGVLGICYGHQLMVHLLGGVVERGEKGEYGVATLEVHAPGELFAGTEPRQQIWMSHRDLVTAPPPSFAVLAGTSTCAIAAMGDAERRLYGVQFHPEVIHTPRGKDLLANFLFRICCCTRDWDPSHQIPQLEEEIRAAAGDRNVFFFVSGGVDSTVAYLLCLRALGPGRVRGVYVDTGLMREGETEAVEQMFASLGAGTVTVEHARDRFLGALEGVVEPERKRQIIGAEFLRVQEHAAETWHLLDGHWVLGQGTIYPDTIESGGTKRAATIKTHHNRVEGVRRLIEEGRLVEPLHSFYKDEVREIGKLLGISPDWLDRHPFPGPGLAIRCLCSEADFPFSRLHEGWVMPVHSVGVQGDSRSYAPVLALDRPPDAEAKAAATDLINRLSGFNRVVALVASHAPLAAMRVRASAMCETRLERLRRADAAVRQISRDGGFDARIWQFPVVLIPAGTDDRPDSVVLRPVDSVDGMTAESVLMPEPLLRTVAEALLALTGVAAVFFDLTNKPPATIEWE